MNKFEFGSVCSSGIPGSNAVDIKQKRQKYLWHFFNVVLFFKYLLCLFEPRLFCCLLGPGYDTKLQSVTWFQFGSSTILEKMKFTLFMFTLARMK